MHVSPNVVISTGNGSNPHKTPTTQPFSFIFVAMIFSSKKHSRLVQWVIWYGEFVVKNGVHAAAYQTCVPQLAVFKLRCSQDSTSGYQV